MSTGEENARNLGNLRSIKEMKGVPKPPRSKIFQRAANASEHQTYSRGASCLRMFHKNFCLLRVTAGMRLRRGYVFVSRQFSNRWNILQSCPTPTWRNGSVRGEYSFLFFTCFTVTVEQDVQSMKLGIHCGCLSRSLASPSKIVNKTEFSTVHIVNLYCVRVQRVCKAKHHDMILRRRDVPSTRRVHLVSLWPVGTREVIFHRWQRSIQSGV